MTTLSSHPRSVEAWVLFSGKADLPWLRLLKPGFRHCYVVMNDGQRWITVDPLSPHTEIMVHHHIAPDFDLIGWLEEGGQKALKAGLYWGHRKPAPIMLFTCVEAVKRLIGLHRRLILTPWQLYRYLKKLTPYHFSNTDKGETSWVQ